MDCSEVLKQLAEYLDEESREELCHQIEQHLTRCRDCQVYVDTVRKTIVLYQADVKTEIPATVTSRLQTALVDEYQRAKAGPSD